MSQDRATQGYGLIGALGVGAWLAEIPRLFLELYRMHRDGNFYDQQDYLAKLQTEQTGREVRVRLLEEEKAERRRREVDDSPFGRSPDEVRQLVLTQTDNGREPALLIAPFTRDPDATDKPTYRLAVSTSWNRVRWRSYLQLIDGLIVRPLHRGDLDLYIIQQILDQIPVVLVHGGIQADRRVWPEIVTWNLIDPPRPSERTVGRNRSFAAYRISLPMIEMSYGTERDAVAAELEVQDTLAGLVL